MMNEKNEMFCLEANTLPGMDTDISASAGSGSYGL